MKYFKVIKNYKEPGHWIAFRIEKSSPKVFVHYSRNDQYKQWFAYLTLFPFYFAKNNCIIEFGIYLIWIKIGFHFQGHYYSGIKRSSFVKPIRLSFNI